jgi:hypothetical protein
MSSSTSLVRDAANDIQELTSISFIERDSGFKGTLIFFCAVFIAMYLYNQNKKAAKYAKMLARYQKQGLDVPQSIRTSIAELSGLGATTIGFWVSASAGLSMLIIMFLM